MIREGGGGWAGERPPKHIQYEHVAQLKRAAGANKKCVQHFRACVCVCVGLAVLVLSWPLTPGQRCGRDDGECRGRVIITARVGGCAHVDAISVAPWQWVKNPFNPLPSLWEDAKKTSRCGSGWQEEFIWKLKWFLALSVFQLIIKGLWKTANQIQYSIFEFLAESYCFVGYWDVITFL